MDIASAESSADSSHASIIERHLMHLAESAAPSGSSRLQSSITVVSRN